MKHLIAILLFCFSTVLTAQTPVIAPAIAIDSVLTAPMNEIIHQFETDTGKTLNPGFDAPGRITRQILKDNPYELFVFSGRRDIDELLKRGTIETNGREFARGQLVIFVSKYSRLYAGASLRSIITAMQFEDYRKITFADSRHLAYGLASSQLLQSGGIWANEQDRMLLAEDINRLVQYALSDVVDVAVVPYSFSKLEQMKDRGTYIAVPAQWYEPISCYTVLQKNASAVAREFERYLGSDKAKAILEQYGYTAVGTLPL